MIIIFFSIRKSYERLLFLWLVLRSLIILNISLFKIVLFSYLFSYLLLLWLRLIFGLIYFFFRLFNYLIVILNIIADLFIILFNFALNDFALFHFPLFVFYYFNLFVFCCFNLLSIQFIINNFSLLLNPINIATINFNLLILFYLFLTNLCRKY